MAATDQPTEQLASTNVKRDIISVFVVTFDPKEGNLLEWYLPQELPLEGVEFRALISGAHTVTSDFIYFRQGDYYGVACYEKLEVTSDVERGARMKSVGVVVASYHHLHYHLDFLAQQVKSMVLSPGSYADLHQYYTTRKAFVPSSWDTPQRVALQDRQLSLPLKPPPGQGEDVGRLLQIFGEQLLVLWRATLLCQRILLLSAPPIGLVCTRVHNLSLLSSHTTPGLPTQLLRPLYYISIAEMDLLQEQHSYVACTTEKIFEEKSGICDIYVENETIKLPVKLQKLLGITANDRGRFSSLQAVTAKSHNNIEEFTTFFTEQNNKIFTLLYRVCGRSKAEVEDADFLAMGLDPQHDRGFLRELAATHGFDLTVSKATSGCCSCTS